MRLLTFSINHSGTARLGHAGLYTATAWLAEMFTSAGIDIVEVCFDRGGLDGVTHVTPQEAATLLANGHITAIYTQYIQPGIPLELASMAWPRVVPIISIGHDLVNAMEPVFGWVCSPTRHRSDIAVISSKAGARALTTMCEICGAGNHWPQVDVEVLPLGIDPLLLNDQRLFGRSHLRKKQNEVIYLWIGRFSETYKADLRPLLIAIRYLHHNYPNIQARLVAIGADQTGMVEKLKNYAQKIGVGDLCSWFPNADTSTRNAWLRQADVFVNVSEHIQETFGLVNLEAMAVGLPIISADWSGFREIIRHGKTGFLIPTVLDATMLPGVNLDVYGGFSVAVSLDMESLIKAMVTLGQDATLRTRMGKAARNIIDTYYISSRIASSYIDLIERRVSIAKKSKPRISSRAWMTSAFSHYSTGHFPDNPCFVEGPIDFNTALTVVRSEELKTEMQTALAAIQSGKNYTIASPPSSEGVSLRRVAIMMLLKLGVITVKTNQLISNG